MWTVINFSMAAKQLQLASTDPATAATLLRFTYGGHEYVLPSASMLLVCASHFYYVLDALINEECILTTMDIVSDGFGYMLAFGDLTWVPFTYSLQARYIVDHPIRLSPLAIAGILGVKILGMYIFRSSNSQKNTFRSNPNHPSVAHLKCTLNTNPRLSFYLPLYMVDCCLRLVCLHSHSIDPFILGPSVSVCSLFFSYFAISYHLLR